MSEERHWFRLEPMGGIDATLYVYRVWRTARGWEWVEVYEEDRGDDGRRSDRRRRQYVHPYVITLDRDGDADIVDEFHAQFPAPADEAELIDQVILRQWHGRKPRRIA